MHSFTFIPDEEWTGRSHIGEGVLGGQAFFTIQDETQSQLNANGSPANAEFQGSTSQYQEFYFDNTKSSEQASFSISFTRSQQDLSEDPEDNWSSSAKTTLSGYSMSSDISGDTKRYTEFFGTTHAGTTVAGDGPVVGGTSVHTDSFVGFGGTTYTYTRHRETVTDEQVTLAYKTKTVTFTDVLGCITTISWTFENEGVTGSSWNTTGSEVAATFTSTEVDYDGDPVTALDEVVVSLDGTWTSTSHLKSPLQVSFFLLDGAQVFDGDWNLGNMLWVLTQVDDLPHTAQRLGVFSDFYESFTNRKQRVDDYSKFETSTVAEGTAIVDSFLHTFISEGEVVSVTRTRTNGYWYTHTSDTASYMDAHTHTLDLGAVGTSLHTYATTTTPGAAPASSIRFTHVSYISGYETSGALDFTTGTTTGLWASTSRSGAANKWASTHAQTLVVSVRSTSTDEILASSHTVIGEGDSTYLVFLGMVCHTVTVVFPKTQVSTSSVFRDASTCSTRDELNTYSTSDGLFTQSSSFRNRQGASHNITRFTYRRVLPVVADRDYNLVPIDPEVRFTVPPRGYMGFCGSFTQPDPAVYLTTTQGLEAGDVFTTDWNIDLPVSMDFSEGAFVSIFPINQDNTPTLAGVGLLRSSLVSFPEGLTVALSIAATWTSTSDVDGETVTSTKLATHTVAMASAISGVFHTAEQIVLDRQDVNIGQNGVYPFTGGWGAGNNRMQDPATVRIPFGRVSWSLRDPAASTGGDVGSASGLFGSVSFTIPAGKVLLVEGEPLLTLSWKAQNTGHQVQFTTPHQSHVPL